MIFQAGKMNKSEVYLNANQILIIEHKTLKKFFSPTEKILLVLKYKIELWFLTKSYSAFILFMPLS